MKNIVIIGNGISGITVARHIRKMSDHKLAVISAESDHFYSRTALMYIYMGHLKFEHIKPYEDWFWEKNKIELINNYVEKVNTENKELAFADGRTLNYDILVLAVGSKSNKFGWPGQDLKGVQGLYNLQDLELMEMNTKNINRAVIIGGGLVGIEMTEMLHSRNIPVTILARESCYWSNVLPDEEATLIGRHVMEYDIDLRCGTELKEILPDENGRVKAVVTNKGEKIDCRFVGLTPGVSPNIDFFKNSDIETDMGILVNEYLETNIPDVYAAGDCAQFRVPLPDRRPVEQVWYTGRMQGETLAKTICGNRTKYQPGIWFNSAKFFDIEYQTYGWVWPKLKDDEETFYWEHKDGKKCFRVVYDKHDGNILGFNVLGMRLRHEVCDRWIRQKKHVDYVMQHLPEANFDPEFFKQHEPEIIASYNIQTEKNIKLISKKGLFAAIFN